MTGYQEIISDPSYAEQIITFTFPHIGNVGTNSADNEVSETNGKGGDYVPNQLNHQIGEVNSILIFGLKEVV